jgi:hypothetical protein
MWHFTKYQVRFDIPPIFPHRPTTTSYISESLILSFSSYFHRYFTHSSDEVIPPSQPPPAPPERKITPVSEPVAVKPATIPSPSLTRSLYKTLRSSIKPFSSPSIKKLSHARSTPDLSTIIAANKKDDDEDTSSSLENLSNIYSTTNSSQSRPAGSILKRRPQPPPQIHEEPIYISSASVPLQQSTIRSVQSMIRDQNTNIPERDKFQTQISQQQQQQPQQSQSPIHNTNQNRRNLEVKKKVWSVDTPDQQQQPIYHTNGNGHYPAGQQSTNGVDYRQAFLKQQEEVQSLRELMLLKDNRIRLLEDELRVLKNRYDHPENELKR